MSLKKRLSVGRVTTEADSADALEVMNQVYQGEKHWLSDPARLLPPEDLDGDHTSWFLARVDDRPIGVTRVQYRLPLELYKAYGFRLVDVDVDVEAFIRENRIAEVGRFAVLPEYRDRILVAATLMRAATRETVERGFTHFITDVFENDPTSPYNFHKRILGFRTVATHDVGELAHEGRRITMVLDLRAAIKRLSKRRSWIFRVVVEGWGERVLSEMGPNDARNRRLPDKLWSQLG